MSEDISLDNRVDSIYDKPAMEIVRAGTSLYRIFEAVGDYPNPNDHVHLHAKDIFFIPVSRDKQFKLSYGGGKTGRITFSVMEGMSVLESVGYGLGEDTTEKDAYHMPKPGEEQYTGEAVLSRLNYFLDLMLDGMEAGMIKAI